MPPVLPGGCWAARERRGDRLPDRDRLVHQGRQAKAPLASGEVERGPGLLGSHPAIWLSRVTFLDSEGGQSVYPKVVPHELFLLVREQQWLGENGRVPVPGTAPGPASCPGVLISRASSLSKA